VTLYASGPTGDAIAAAAHAEQLHTVESRTPGGPPPGSWFTMASSAAYPAIAAGIRCCTPQQGDGHEPFCPVYGYPPPPNPHYFCSSADDRPCPTGEHVNPHPANVPGLADGAYVRFMQSIAATVALDSAIATWEDIATFAAAADARIIATPDGYWFCRAAYDTTGPADGEYRVRMDPSPCRSWDTARLDSACPTDRPVGELVMWLATHWGCTDAT
jgi:hypothetical protein